MIKSIILSLILTILLEVLLSYTLLGIRKIKDLKIVMFVNIYTNPIVVFLSNIVQLMNNVLVYYFAVFTLELGAIIVEALLYKAYLKESVNPMRLSIYNNMFSFFAGLILLVI